MFGAARKKLCIPFIITSMGGLCTEGHEFLRVCMKKNVEKTHHMMDVLITQHAKWTARRIKRSLFGQCLIDFSTESWTRVLLDKDAHHSKQQRCINLQHNSIPRLIRQFSSFSVLGASQDSQPPEIIEEETVDVGSDSEESAYSQPSFKQPPEGLNAASEEVLQTSVLSHSANTLRTEHFECSSS